MSNNLVADALQEVLQASYAVFLMTHNYHWNVEGPQFASLHALLEEHYTEYFEAVDTIAERIRTLDSYALKTGYGDIAKSLADIHQPLESDKNGEAKSKMMLSALIKLNETLIESCKKAKEAAVKADDDESEDLMIQRIDIHQKNNWMYKSTLA
ncbi:MAG: DNA starvation/stationary phase protection protein [Pseudomonadota bacterium]